MKSTASAEVLYIFQLPAISGFRKGKASLFDSALKNKHQAASHCMADWKARHISADR
jgi:hypothetical protein